MIITRITAFVVKTKKRYDIAGQCQSVRQLPGSDYLVSDPYPELYSQCTEAMVVKVETDEGITGWGEAQAPIGPEIAQTIVRRIIGPRVLGMNPLDTNCRFQDMYNTNRVRGQVTGYQLDAIAAIDTALWDIRGKVAGLPVSSLLGGRFRDRLPCYATCLLGETIEARKEEAMEWARQGIGVKPVLGFGFKEDVNEVCALREGLGDDGLLMVDGVWRYTFPEAVRLARALEDYGVSWFESPLWPEDIRSHTALSSKVDIPIAIGEPLRTLFQFQPWFEARAMSIAQPDVMRNGVSETWKIACVAESFNMPVALHMGVGTVVGMAATWQVASALCNFHIQEHEPQMLEQFNPWLNKPLQIEEGKLVVPDGPGLGIDIDEERFLKDVDGSINISVND